MTFEKARIEPHGRAPISVLFNPGEYRIEGGVKIGESEMLSLASPFLEYLGRNAQTLTLDLFFDTYESMTDVSAHTDQIYALMEADEATRVPPLCTFRWGSLVFTGALVSVSGHFKLFFPDGRPARAVLSVQFKETLDAPRLARTTRMTAAGRRTIRTVKRGESLNSIAAEVYGDARRWRAIATANGIADPTSLRPGQRLLVP